MEDLISFDATTKEGDSVDASEDIPINITESEDFEIFCVFYEYSLKIKKIYVSSISGNFGFPPQIDLPADFDTSLRLFGALEVKN
jgi:hypothetical protein